ncbi:MAG: S-layer homology domain-containing protein [Bacillota bacterium]|nr:S-layer homology domain-containing protein [Bacillota bacterium]
MQRPRRGLIALFALLALVLAVTPGLTSAAGPKKGQVATAVRFGDLEEYPWAEAAVEALAERGVFQGTAAGTFSPSGFTNRAEMAAVLGRLEGWQPTPAQSAYAARFRDAGAIPAWARAWVAVAARNRVLMGYPGGRFQPQEKITWAQLAVLVARVFQYPPVPAGRVAELLAELPRGAQTPYWAAEAVAQNVEQGNFQGVLRYLYDPNRPVTRAELALFLEAAVEHRNPQPPAPQPSVLVGTVTAVTYSDITLSLPRLPAAITVTLPLAGDVSVSVYGQPGSLADVTAGAQVRVTVDAAARVTSITVLPPPLPAPVESVTGFAVGWSPDGRTLGVYTPTGSSPGLHSYVLLPGARVTLDGQPAEGKSESLLGQSVSVALDAQGQAVGVAATTPAAPVVRVWGYLVGTATGGTTEIYRDGIFTPVDLGTHPLAFRGGQTVDPSTLSAGTPVVVDQKALADGSALVIVAGSAEP